MFTSLWHNVAQLLYAMPWFLPISTSRMHAVLQLSRWINKCWLKKPTTCIHLDAKNINLISNTALISDFYQVNTIELSKDKKTVMHNLNYFSFFFSPPPPVWGTPRHSCAKWETQPRQHILGLTWGLATVGHAQNTSPRGTQAACWSDAQTPQLAALNVAPLLRAYPLRVRYGNEYSLAIL